MHREGRESFGFKIGFPIALTLAYGAAGLGWLLTSDYLLSSLGGDSGWITAIRESKGWIFLIISGALLFGFARHYSRLVEQAHRRLEDERDFIDSVLDTADALVVVMGVDGRIERFNRACERMTGYDAEEVVGRSVWELFVVPEEVEHHCALFQQMAERATLSRGESHWVTRDGNRRLVSWSSAVLKDGRGGVKHIVATGTDVTEQRATMRALQASEALYHEIMDAASDAIFVADIDSGVIVKANRRAGELVGRPPQELVGMHQTLLHPPEEANRYRKLFQNHLRGVLPERVFVQRADGSRVPVEISTGTSEVEGRILVQGIFRDISERITTEEQLRKLSRVVEVSPNLIMMTDREGRIEYCNPRFCEVTGYSQEEVLGQNPRLLKSDETDAKVYADLWRTILSGSVWYGEFRNRKKNGQLYWSLMSISPIRDQRGEITHFVGIAEDISRLKFAESTIRHLAYFDPLTNLPNRALFKDRLGQVLSHARQHRELMALLFIDLDRFKTANDSLGHAAGDELLVGVAKRLSAAIPAEATLARLGGDEFAVILPGLSQVEAAAQCARQLGEVLQQPMVVGERDIFITASIGISLYPQDGEELDALIANADLAMYRAKETGRNTYRFFTADLNSASLEQLGLQASLRHAVDRNQFDVYYQPKVASGSGAIVGFEALVRWNHPDLGLVSPAKFIPTAEETGLIIPIGEWVLRTACMQLTQWQAAGFPHLHVAVNLSAKQFALPDLPERVARILAETGMRGDALELEITENDVMHKGEEAVALLERLKGMGLRLSVDDFGTGYSSLGYLKRFPIDVLKIDKSFVRDVTTDSDDAAIAAAIIAMGHTMRLRVVAEGVESAEQLAFLSAQGCDEYQGFYFSPPVPGEQAWGLLQGAGRWQAEAQ